MPQLKERNVEVKKIYLPSTTSLAEDQQAWAELEVGNITTLDVLGFHQEDFEAELRAVARALVGRIKDWNFTEKDGTKTPINFDTVSRLEPEDFMELAKTLKEVQGNDPAPLAPRTV